MKVALLLKSGPSSTEAHRALQVAADMMSQGHAVHLYLLQEAVRFSRPCPEMPASIELNRLVDEGLRVNYLVQDAQLRGIDETSVKHEISSGSFENLLGLMESCDQVIGLL